MFFSIFIIVQSSLLSNFRTFSSTIISHFQFSLPLPPPPSQTSWQPLIYFLFLWICLFWTLQMNAAAAAAKSFQSCLTLWDPIDGSPQAPPSLGFSKQNTGVVCHFLLQCMKVKKYSEVAQSCPTPSDLMDCSPPGPSVHGICQARVLGWVATAFSKIKKKIRNG